MVMRSILRYVSAGTLTLGGAAVLHAQSSSSRLQLGDYLMPNEAELALAASAAPPNVAGKATFKVLTASGYRVEREGSNGFTCLVLRAWAAPTSRLPAP